MLCSSEAASKLLSKDVLLSYIASQVRGSRGAFQLLCQYRHALAV